MKKVFMVEVDYEELGDNIENKCEVFNEVGLEIAVENLIEGYRKTNSIKGYNSVEVKEVK